MICYSWCMNLHRHSGKAEWEDIALAKRNYWQRLAVRTNGAITPPNAATSIGLIISSVGVYLLLTEQYVIAATFLAIGRIFDIIDGYLAELTGTKSPFGEGFDAVADKIVVFLVLLALITTQAAPLWAVTIIAVPQIITVFVVRKKRKQNIQSHPSVSGKYGVALSWLALCGYILESGLKLESEGLYIASSVLAILSASLSTHALQAYARAQSK